MDEHICFKYDYFVVFVVISVGIIIWVLYDRYSQVNHIISQFKQQIEDIGLGTTQVAPQVEQPVAPQISHQPSDVPDNYQDGPHRVPQRNVYQLQRTSDYQRSMDPMFPPLQRGMYPPTNEYQLPFNIPTQGGYGNFQQVGYVHSHKNPDQMFRLMGRQMGSSRYEYYVIHPYNEIKIPIRSKNDWELNTGDRVEITGFPGHYLVEIYDIDRPRYVPY
jgi:hypothetical protein